VPVPASPTTTVTPTPTTPNPVSVIHSVTIQNFSFSPASLNVKMGDTVVWTNKDSVAHNVVGTNGGPASPAIPTNGTYSYTFMSPGTFAYRCTFHPAMPPGTVVVTQ
jgi:plastocyanin